MIDNSADWYKRSDLSQVRLEFKIDPAVGVYIYIWLKPDSAFPEYDYLQDTLLQAARFCTEELGIQKEIVDKYLPQ